MFTKSVFYLNKQTNKRHVLSPILVMGSIAEIFPLCNGVFLIITIKQTYFRARSCFNLTIYEWKSKFQITVRRIDRQQHSMLWHGNVRTTRVACTHQDKPYAWNSLAQLRPIACQVVHGVPFQSGDFKLPSHDKLDCLKNGSQNFILSFSFWVPINTSRFQESKLESALFIKLLFCKMIDRLEASFASVFSDLFASVVLVPKN